MKAALSILLTLALLVHGTVAVSMAPAMAHAEAAMADDDGMEGMPCHQGGHAKAPDHEKAEPCCQPETCAYQVFCTGALMNTAAPMLNHVFAATQSFAPLPALALSPHRLSLLRPPIPLSA